MIRLRNETEGAMRFIGGFLLGLVAGYGVILFTWVGYTNLVRVNDFEGAASMQVAFFLRQSAGSSLVCWSEFGGKRANARLAPVGSAAGGGRRRQSALMVVIVGLVPRYGLRRLSSLARLVRIRP